MKAASGTAEIRLTLLPRSPEGVGYPSPAVIPAKAGITKHPGSSATRRNDVARKAASGTAEVRLTLLLRSPEGDGDPSPAVIPAKAGITMHTGSSATRRNGVPMKAASGTTKARLTLFLRSPEGDRDPQPCRHSCEGRNHDAHRLIRESAQRRSKEGRQRNGRGTANPLAAITRRRWGSPAPPSFLRRQESRSTQAHPRLGATT